MFKKELPALQKCVTIADLVELGRNATDILQQVRELILEPKPTKSPPTFTFSQICSLCDVEKTKAHYLANKHGLPKGKKKESGRSSEYSLEEVYEYVKVITGRHGRPKGKRGRIIAVCNYKGGVAKTGTVVPLAQALTLLGYRCLLIDADPQGSATQLLGVSPDIDVQEEDTLMPLVFGDEKDLLYAAKPTYWPNLDLVPACSDLLSAEFFIPAPAASGEKKRYQFWDIFNKGTEPLRDVYDVILIDTSPSLSYVTINSLMAADALIMPCPPDASDFASSTQFWKIFADLGSKLPGVAETKTYDFIGILPTKVKDSRRDSMNVEVKRWMHMAYGAHMLPMEIPDSSAASAASNQYKTIYDLSKPDGSTDAYNRYKEPLDRLARYVDEQLTNKWRA